MNQSAIFAPMVVQMLLVMTVWILLFARRIPFIRRNRLTDAQLAPATFARLQPPAVSLPADNLANLFELPVLFYILCLMLYVTAQVDGVHLVAAWCFVLLRIGHSVVHCTSNIILLRFGLYFLSSLALWLMLLRIAAGLL